MSVCAVVMAGGSGTRLWPLSRVSRPKQFLSLNGSETMLQSTMNRLGDLPISDSITICNEEHRFFVAEQLRQVDQLGTVILEPEGRNTAPAIALAALVAEQDPLLLVLAADHVIGDEVAFNKSVLDAIPLAEQGKLVTFGIVANSPHTGYGYIKAGVNCGEGFHVERFVEKPSLETARGYIADGGYMWNSGMFLFRASRYLEELEKFRSDIFNVCVQCMADRQHDLDFVRIESDVFKDCPSESVDYAVMEHTQDAVVVPMDAQWNDIGSWTSLWDVSDKDPSGNTVLGDVILHDTKNSYVRSEDKLVSTVGVKDMVVVSTKDVVMVAHKDSVQDVKVITEQLKQQQRSEWQLHREVHRPWGKYDSIDCGARYQVKRITVKPGAKLSVQYHHHRSEHWVVVSGQARVTNGDKTFVLSENESTYIPVEVVHALENPGTEDLILIEVQSGSYLGEDDIVRLSDNYGRA